MHLAPLSEDSVPEAVTLFSFACEFCSTANEYVHEHAADVQPFLISTKCTGCRKLNKLGGLEGILIGPSASGSRTNNMGRVMLVQLRSIARAES